MNRKSFLTTSVATIAGLCVTPAHSLTTLVDTHQNHDFYGMLNKLETFSLQNMPPGFVRAFISFSNEELAKNHFINSYEIFKLNDTCYAMRIEKNSLFSKKNELVLFVKSSFEFNYYLLEENLISAYNQIVSNYIESSKAMELDLDVLKFTAPTKILDVDKKLRKKQLVFQNYYGNTITLVTDNKKNFVMVC